MSVLIVQHLPHEHEGILGEALVARGVPLTRWRAWAEPTAVPDLHAHDAIVVLGGDMNTDEDDDWPHLARVRGLLTEAVEEDVPVLAICLGAQLLAEATGGRVTHGTPEIGYIPIVRTAAGHAEPTLTAVPDAAPFFNAHADFITAPPDATILASSAAAPVHAYRVGSALGLQFHPEIDASFVAGYVVADGVERYLSANGWTGERLLEQARTRNAEQRRLGLDLLGAWVDSLDLDA